MAAEGGVARGVRKGQVLQVTSHGLGDVLARQLEHPLRDVDSDHPRPPIDQVAGGVSRAAGEVQHALSRAWGHQLDGAQPAQADDLLVPGAVGGGVPAEHDDVQVLGLQLRLRQASSSASATSTSRASPAKCPTTWTPTGRPSAGAGSPITGCPVVLNGRV